MKRDEVIAKLCQIVSAVYDAKADYSKASDCFCKDSPFFQHEGETIEFVRQAVAEKLAKENPDFNLKNYMLRTE